MSVDNGIYVLITKGAEGLEYRVAHCMGVENMYYDVNSGEHKEDFTPEEAFRYFKDSEVFVDCDAAWNHAHKTADGHSILEYGVCGLNHPDQVFETFSEERLEFYEAEVDEIMERHRQERSATLEKRRRDKAIIIEPGTTVEVSTIHGALLKTPDGEVRGTVQGVGTISFEKEMEFLPHGWNE